MSALTPVPEALAHMLEHVQPVHTTETCALARAAGRVLAADCRVPRDVPPCDNSAMDGYALRCEDAVANAWLPVSQRVAAGQWPSPLAPGSAARIFTGAPIPEGADAVVPQETVARRGETHCACQVTPEPGQHIRRSGEDLRRGDTALRAGRRLNGQALGLCASLGQATVSVRSPIKVAVLSTGDELLEPGEAERPGKIYNSNRYTLFGLLHACNAEIVDLGRIPDDAEATRDALRRASQLADCTISSGGVSVGEADHVTAALRAEGQLSLWKLALKPGKPLAFGQIDRRPVFCLPGNPVAVFVTFWVLLRPVLERLAGIADVGLEAGIPVCADFSWPASPRRQQYLRARMHEAEDGELWAQRYPEQGSHALSSIAWADSLLVVPPGVAVRPGSRLRALPLR